MINFKYIINYLRFKLKMYTYNLQEERFILNDESDQKLHSRIFDDLKTIDIIFKYHKITYTFNEKNFTISIDNI